MKSKWIVNLSSKDLNENQLSILEKDLKFAPTPRKIPRMEIVTEVENAIIHLDEINKAQVRTDVTYP